MKTTMDKHWKWIFLVYLFVLLFISFGGALTMSGQNNWERGVYWVTPVDGRTYGTEILLNGRVYCKEEIQSAELILMTGRFSLLSAHPSIMTAKRCLQHHLHK